MNSPLLSEADFLRLESILDPQAPPPRPSHEQRTALQAYLQSASRTADARRLETRAGLGDEVTLVSPADPSDDFQLRIVMPHEADPAEGLISLLAPVSMAVLGRETGGIISWPANGAMREMRVASVIRRADAAEAV